MNPRTHLIILAVAFLGLISARGASPDDQPDILIFKSGERLHGLVVRNNASSITWRHDGVDAVYPKQAILRLIDCGEPEVSSTLPESGDLPGWSVIANDLRARETIERLEEVRDSKVTGRAFRNVPFLAYRVNDHINFEIFGNPQSPAAIRISLHGDCSSDSEARLSMRDLLAGFLGSRAEIASLYALNMEGGETRDGAFTVAISKSNAQGGSREWSVSVRNNRGLERARLSAPACKRLIAGYHACATGFYRDATGDLHLDSAARKLAQE